MTKARDSVLGEVADLLCRSRPGHPLRVGIDGVCGVGKSTFAGELVDRIRAAGRHVVRLDSDGFHHVREVRHRQGRDSARGYYEDAYDFDTLRELTLVPLGPGGSHRYAARVHDLATDELVREWAVAPDDAIVVFDATFLQRGDLRPHWDHVVFLDADLERAQSRGVARDSAEMGGTDEAARAYETRYMAACRLYLAEEDPRSRASVVVEHSDPAGPYLVRYPGRPDPV